MENKRFTFLKIWLISLIIGCGNEITAYLTSVWIYHPWWMAFVNLLLMFGIVMPILAYLLLQRYYLEIFFVGTLIGLIYELLDQYILFWASFPNNQFLFLHDPFSIRLFIALLWGLVPMVLVWITKKL